MSNLSEKPNLKIIKLKPQDETINEIIKDDLILLLENITKDVKSGKLKGLAFLGISNDKEIFTGYSKCVLINPFLSIGGLEVLKDRIKENLSSLKK